MSKKIILGVTGSIAAYKAAEIIQRLKEKTFDVTVIMSEGGKKFITPVTLAALSQKKVYDNMFDFENQTMPHIELAKQADLILIAPASANVIGRLANGLANDLLTTVVMATEAKILIAPAMNEKMYRHPLVQQNCDILKHIGYEFIDPVEGDLACGDYGKGHLASEQTIVDRVEKLLK